MNKVNSYTSWQPLEEVIVGRAYTPDYFDFIEDAQVRNQLQQILEETNEDLKQLAKDIFLYFGLGCRNVSKLYLPSGYDTDKLFNAFFDYKDVINHLKYSNNYDYNKTVYLMNSEKLLDNGFVLLKEDKSIQSPVATVFFEYYNNRSELNDFIEDNKVLFQCIVSKDDIEFGQTQFPKINDYSDQVDTIKFLFFLHIFNNFINGGFNKIGFCIRIISTHN